MWFPYKKNTPVEFRFIFLEFWDKTVFWDPRAPSMGVTILRKGHLVHVRGTIFNFFSLIFVLLIERPTSPKKHLVHLRGTKFVRFIDFLNMVLFLICPPLLWCDVKTQKTTGLTSHIALVVFCGFSSHLPGGMCRYGHRRATAAVSPL